MRWLLLLVAVPSLAHAGDDSEPAPDDDRQRAIAVELGATGGGGATPGGMRVGGRYLYRLAAHDWFDGGVAFTFGTPRAACGRVAPYGMECAHGPVDGFAGDLSLGVRRDLPGQQGFVPFVRAAVFGRVLRFERDDVSGAAAGLELGVGLRAAVRGDLSIVAGANGFAGLAHLGADYGNDGQLGLTINAGAELRMK